ncbi:MAG TPA: hypothetical protein LFV92_07855 [Rickettsia endosymbiont of Ceroptres masudai]|nr:hypothetical protein [Rickettsia endosymbiont of Ceroptres masudai]
MSKLIEFLKNIGAARTLNLLAQYPAALSIGACRQPLLNDITIRNVQDVLDALKGDKSITKLTIYDFDKENIISLLANFLEDAECYITSSPYATSMIEHYNLSINCYFLYFYL